MSKFSDWDEKFFNKSTSAGDGDDSAISSEEGADDFESNFMADLDDSEPTFPEQDPNHYEIPISNSVPGSSKILVVDKKDDGLYYGFGNEQGGKSKQFGPFLLDIEEDLLRIFQRVGGRAKKFESENGSIIAIGNFDGKNELGNFIQANKMDLGIYGSGESGKNFVDILNCYLEDIKNVGPINHEVGRELDSSGQTISQGKPSGPRGAERSTGRLSPKRNSKEF